MLHFLSSSVHPYARPAGILSAFPLPQDLDSAVPESVWSRTGRHVRGIFHRHNTFAFQTDLSTGLCSFRNLADHISV